jgi:hypothetical protein
VKSLRIAHQKSGIDAKELRQQRARCVGQVRPAAAFDLRKVRLADRPSELLAHGAGNFLLSHRAFQPAQRAFDGSQVPNFFRESHDHNNIAISNLFISYCNSRVKKKRVGKIHENGWQLIVLIISKLRMLTT